MCSLCCHWIVGIATSFSGRPIVRPHKSQSMISWNMSCSSSPDSLSTRGGTSPIITQQMSIKTKMKPTKGERCSCLTWCGKSTLTGKDLTSCWQWWRSWLGSSCLSTLEPLLHSDQCLRSFSRCSLTYQSFWLFGQLSWSCSLASECLLLDSLMTSRSWWQFLPCLSNLHLGSGTCRFTMGRVIQGTTWVLFTHLESTSRWFSYSLTQSWCLTLSLLF